VLGSLNGVVSGGGGFGRCCLVFFLVLSLLGCRCIRLLCLRRLGPGLLGFLVPLTCRSGCGFRLHLLAGLADPGQPALLVPQLLRQLTAALALAVLAILLGVEDLGLPHQGIDFLLQLLLSPEHPLMTHGFVLGGIGLHLGAIQRHMAQAHHPGLLTQAEDRNEHTLKGIEVTAAEVADSAVIGLLIAGQQPERLASPAVV
jgi:hypothetical protein